LARPYKCRGRVPSLPGEIKNEEILRMTLDNIIEEINKASSIVILTHENPDGDAIRKQFSII